MKIALDYDGTFTEDKELWASFVITARSHGHEVKFVTFREQEDTLGNRDIVEDAEDLCIPIIFTSGGQKAKFYKADVWIDDHPELIPDPNSKYIIPMLRNLAHEQTSLPAAGDEGKHQDNQGAGVA